MSKRFNQKEAVQVVTDLMDKQIQEFGNILYVSSGGSPYQNDLKHIPNNSYDIFRNKCKQSLVTLYGHNSMRMYEFLEIKLARLIMSKFFVNSVYYKNDVPEFGRMNSSTYLHTQK